MECERDGADGSGGVGDIIALCAVASGQGSDEGAIFVSNGEGNAVDFGFAGEGDLRLLGEQVV